MSIASTNFYALPAPSALVLSPNSGTVATVVTIAGSNFGAIRGSSTVAFNGALATPTAWSNTSITVPVPNAATSGNVVVTVNGSASPGAAFTVLPGSYAAQILNTRGFSKTLHANSDVNLEYCTRRRWELPYGARSGNWTVSWCGYNDGTLKSILIRYAGLWYSTDNGVTQIAAGALTFNGGSAGVTILHDTVLACDPINVDIPIGAVVWVSTQYYPPDAVTLLPNIDWMLSVESAAGRKDFDIAQSGAIGSLANLTQTSFGTVFGSAISAWGPAWGSGLPNSAFSGTAKSYCVFGDSITFGFNDAFTVGQEFSARSYFGRAASDQIPWVRFAVGGSGIVDIINADGSAWFNAVFGDGGSQAPLVQKAVNAYGINDVRTGPTPYSDFKPFLLNGQTIMANMFSAIHIPTVQGMFWPCEQADTSYTNSGDYAAFSADLLLWNSEVRAGTTGVPNVVGFFDTKSCFIDLSTNAWTVAARSDGLHPSAAGHASTAADMTL